MNYTTEEKICIYLGQSGLTASKFYALTEHFDGVNDFLKNVGESDFAREILGGSYRDICLGLKNGKADKTIEQMESHGVCATTCFSESFPETLVNISDPPYILFYKGNPDLLKSRCFSVVGTRKVSTYGKNVATAFTEVLAKHFTIVSGLAYGVDSIAHETTLRQSGKTIAVLGGGIVDVYPSANRALAERIVQSGGLLLTEYGFDATPLGYRFPHRNRIVSGLSLGILVCQSPLKSGTTSTVEWALEQGRDIFAVPGEVFDNGFAGNNHLIKTSSAFCVTTPTDILEYYRIDADEQKKVRTVQLDFDEQKVVEALSTGQLSFDKLVEKTKILPSDLNFLLANLEIKSIICRLPGNSYRLHGGLE